MFGTALSTASISSCVMSSLMSTSLAPARVPPTNCISIMLGPMLEMYPRANWRPVSPSVATRMMEAAPITMPSIVSRKRVLLAEKLSSARVTVSRNATVERALRSVLSNERADGRNLSEAGGTVGLGMPVWVAMGRALQKTRAVQTAVPHKLQMLQNIAATRHATPALPPIGEQIRLQRGRVAEWLMAPVLKTGVPERVSGVRIPPLPPYWPVDAGLSGAWRSGVR